LTKEELTKLIQETVDAMRKQPGDTPVVGAPTEAAHSFDMEAALRDIGMATSPLAGGYLLTEKGSIINTMNPMRPWVKLSKEMEAWVLAFKEFVNSRGNVVSKLLQESSDPAGGYVYAV
jgi:hypothetical protein